MATKTTVVNVNSGELYDVYVGRSAKYGGPSRFGNPFRVKGIGREEAIARYKINFHFQLLVDPEFKASLEELSGKALGCHCKPLLCHADIIAAYLNGATFY